MNQKISRRQWMRSCTVTGTAAALASRVRGTVSVQPEPEYRIFWGDLHSHNNVGYAQGSLRRSFEIARNHLDFFFFTPHAHWHDIGHYEANIEHKWINGFAVTRARWPEVLEMAREFHEPGRFITIAGYEWHSTSVGDYHVLFPDLDAELYLPDDLGELQAFARRRGCLLIPHHPANRLGHRGANFALRDSQVSPLLEIYSEWGNAEHDRAPKGYIRHTEGGRWTRNTLQYLLAQGHRVGVIASTDDHLGYPGAWGEGLAAVLAPELSREALFDALRSRRTYAVTGDRIRLDFTLDGKPMGQELPFRRERTLQVGVTGWDQVDRVEILKNNRVVHRDFPMDRVPRRESWNGPLLVRFEYGWGPWPVLGIGRTADWDIQIELQGGTLEEVQTGFQSGPLDEERWDRVVEQTERSVRVHSFTALRQQFEDRSQKSVVLRLRGTPETRLTVSLQAPAQQTLTVPLRELAESGETLFTGDFPKESALLHRLVFSEHSQTSFRFEDEGDGSRTDWYYLRVVQANEQLAWSSPIWVEAS